MPFLLLFLDSNNATWTGMYQVASGYCPTSVCCCMSGVISVRQVSYDIYLESPVTGHCDGQSSFKSGPVDLLRGNQVTAPFAFNGEQYRAQLSGPSLSVNSLNSTKCTNYAENITDGARTTRPSQGLVGWEIALIIVAAILLVVLLIGGIVTVYILKKPSYQSLA
jgi:hypothetical protein